MQHLQPVEGLQALGNLLDDAAHGDQVRLRIVDHPLCQRLAFDVFGDHIDASCRLPRLAAGFQDVRAVDAAGDPLFKQEALKRSGVGLHVDRRNLDDDASRRCHLSTAR
jgi:hypothetical protein